MTDIWLVVRISGFGGESFYSYGPYFRTEKDAKRYVEEHKDSEEHWDIKQVELGDI